MNGVHDMGGMDGFGKVEVEQNEPPFHETWEGRVLAMQRAMGYAGAWHIDDSRYAQETLPPRTYLAVSYYQRWALAWRRTCCQRGFVTEDELKAGHSLRADQAAAAQAHEGCRGRRHDAQLVLPPAAGPCPLQAGRPRAHREHQSADPHPPAALCARQGRHGRADPRLPRLPGFGRDRSRRRSAVALHGRVRRPRDLGTGHRSDARRSRSTPSSPISNRHDGSARPSPSPASRATPKGRCSASRGRRRPSPWRWRCTSAACSPGRNGRPRLPTRSSGRRRRAIPTPARPTTRHWLNALERLVTEKGIADASLLARYHDAWDHAADRTQARRSDRAQAGGFQVDEVFRHFGRSRTDSQSPPATLFSRDGGRSTNERCRLEELQGRRVGHRLGTGELQRAMGRRQGVRPLATRAAQAQRTGSP